MLRDKFCGTFPTIHPLPSLTHHHPSEPKQNHLIQEDGETLHREITLCTETWAAIRDKDFVKVFYSCFVRYIIFSMSERSQTDIDHECLGLWASFGEVRKRKSVLAPGELFTMENCVSYTLRSLALSDITSFSSQRNQTSSYIQTLLGLSSETENLWVPTLPASGTGAFRNLTSWYNQIEGT